MSSHSEEWVLIGRFGRPRGIKGFVKVISFTDPSENIINYAPWYVLLDKCWQPLKVSAYELSPKSIFVLIDGFSDREQAATLTNTDIAIKKKQLPELSPGEYYWHQLIGMSVVNLQGEILGTVNDMIATGANDVLVVTGNQRHLIPYVADKYVIRINDALSQIVVDWNSDF